MIHVRRKVKLGLGVVLTAALVCSLVLIAAPVSASAFGTLTKTITHHDDGSAITCANPMSGIVDFVFDYTSPQVVPDADSLVLQVTAPAPYDTAGDEINMWFYFPAGVETWDDASERSMMEMGVVDWSGDGSLQDEGILAAYLPGDAVTGCSFTIAFSLDTEKNWSRDTDDLAADPDYYGIDSGWDRPAHTSVWPMGPCTAGHPDGKYHIDSMVYAGGAGGNQLLEVILEQDDPLYNDPYMLPSLGIDVKGSVQCFYAKNTGPDVIVKWEVLPGVNSPVVVIEGGGQPGDDWICVSSAIPGDAIVKAFIDTDQDQVADLVISGEKKWGDIHHTELVADKTANIVDGDEVDIDEMVYATIHWGSMDPEDEVVMTAGGALVHWWLINNTDDENQALIIDLLEAIFEGTVTEDHPYYQICGTYADPDNPYAILDAFATTHAATNTEFIAVEGVPVDGGTVTYVSSVTDDSIIPPDVERGWTQTTVKFTDVPATLETEEVMVVLLAEYPLINMFHGENPVCVEFVKLTPEEEIPEVQVKIPQVAWAGEKIVLEKKWGLGFMDNVVKFQIDQGSIGTLSPISGTGGGQVVETTVGCDGVARCILETEYQGQAEVKCILYDYLGEDVIDNHDFPVFFLKLESVEAIGTYPTVEVETDVDFGIQVKGWFTSSNLSTREYRWVDHDGDGVMDEILPAGRWVLPDDWPTLAGIYETRRHWDLMDNATDAIDSTSALGPFNTDVVTTDPPGDAEKNVVGPFNTTQPVAIEDELVKWVATATVVGDDTLLLPADLRCTVVPNGILEWQDCPMPAAYTVFTVSGTILSEALKTGVAGYFTGSNFIWPFYSYEIPSSQFIPIGGAPEGYRHDSWGWGGATAEGPYPFWEDLGVSTATTKLEVYTDNNGRAYVTMDALAIAGTADISAIVDYPYQRKHPAMKSATTRQTWGEILVTCTWSFSAAGFFPKHLPDAYTGEVVLADLVLADIPAEVQGVWYDDAGTWIFWMKGAPDPGDLLVLQGGLLADYNVLVSGACDWIIPLP